MSAILHAGQPATGWRDIAALAQGGFPTGDQVFTGTMRILREGSTVFAFVDGTFSGTKPSYGYVVPVPAGFQPDSTYRSFTLITNAVTRADWRPASTDQCWALAQLAADVRVRDTAVWHTSDPRPTALPGAAYTP